MNTLTIPRELANMDDLIIIPRKIYEALLSWKNSTEEFVPTIAQKMALARAENNFKKNKTLSYNELIEKMGFAN